MSRFKKIAACLFGSLLLAFASLVPVMAAGETGLEVVLKNDDRTWPGVELKLVKVASLEADGVIVEAGFEADPASLVSTDPEVLQNTANALAHQALRGAMPGLEAVSDESGSASFDPPTAGIWLLYSPSEDPVVSPALVYMSAADQRSVIYPKISSSGLVRIIKADPDKKAIKDRAFAFGIYQDATCKDLIQRLEGDPATGSIQLKLEPGTLYIKELEAPKGYKLSDEVVKVEMEKDRAFFNDVKTEGPGLVFTYIYIDQPEGGKDKDTGKDKDRDKDTGKKDTGKSDDGSRSDAHTAAGPWQWGLAIAGALLVIASIAQKAIRKD